MKVEIGRFGDPALRSASQEELTYFLVGLEIAFQVHRVATLRSEGRTHDVSSADRRWVFVAQRKARSF